MCSLTSFILVHSTVSYSDTFKRLINVPRYTSPSLAFAMNVTDHINVVFRKFAYSLMSRVIAYPDSIVTAIIIIIIILESAVQGRERGETLYQSKDPNPTQPTNGRKKKINSDAYHQSTLMNKCESMLYV